jgi:hypothetical protein
LNIRININHVIGGLAGWLAGLDLFTKKCGQKRGGNEKRKGIIREEQQKNLTNQNHTHTISQF